MQQVMSGSVYTLKSRRNYLQLEGFVILFQKSCNVNHGTRFSAKLCLHKNFATKYQAWHKITVFDILN